MPLHDPSDEAAQRAYDTVADLYADTFRATEPEQAEELASLKHFVALVHETVAQPRILGAGCGAGRMLPLLARRGAEVTGIDLSPNMVKRARADHAQFAVTVGSLLSLPFSTAGFDGVASWYSTIHHPDLATMVTEVVRVTRPGGHVLVAFQAGHGTRDISEAYRRRGHGIVLERYLRATDEISAAVESAGAAVIHRMERRAAGPERDAQAVVIARKP